MKLAILHNFPNFKILMGFFLGGGGGRDGRVDGHVLSMTLYQIPT